MGLHVRVTNIFINKLLLGTYLLIKNKEIKIRPDMPRYPAIELVNLLPTTLSTKKKN